MTPLALELGPVAGRRLRVLWRLLLVALAFSVVQTATGVAGSFGDDLFANVLTPAIPALAAALCFARARLFAPDRGAWLAMSVGLGLWALAELYWVVFFSDPSDIPYPSPADALWLAFYLTSYVALMALIRARVRSFQASMWLDGLIAALGAAGLVAALVFKPALTQTHASGAALATNLAYPIGDLLLIAMVFGMFALSGWRAERAWLVLAAGLLASAVGDSIFVYQSAMGTYQEGTLLDVSWALSASLVAMAAWQRERTEKVELQGWPGVVVSSLFTLSSVGVLIYGNVADVPVATLALCGSAAVCAVLRTALAFRDVRSLADSRRSALTDDLTGLPNRRAFYERLRAAVQDLDDSDVGLAVMIVDLARFKELNDALGHHAGDLVLQRFGPRMRRVLRATDTLARLDGDEFGVLVEGGADRRVLAKVVDRLTSALAAPLELDGLDIRVDATIGVALAPAHGSDVDTLVQRADVAMYEARKSGATYAVYAHERDEHSSDRLALMSELSAAITAGQLVLHYQPKADLRTGEIVGVEALVRWQHPTRGLLPPADFIQMAEQTGLMGSLTMRVMDMALRQACEWRHSGWDVGMAVNLSASNLDDPELGRKVERLLTRWNVPPSSLQLEITEDVMMADVERADEVTRGLRELGVELALDDFGTGYSSLAYLRHLPVDELKLDRSFVTDVNSEEKAAQIVGSVVLLARELGLRVVAEGVETESTWNALTALGCDIAQGYFLAHPLPADELETWMASRNAGATGKALATVA
ncbi:MAG: hypothetical protein QOE69_15 [Thermoleophilaceae bacterium]|nr:hypothetical protein [Thermoleophilaceae bacterium]